ncbi:hypothetical protein [Neodiprion abietis nucleopolyhedrovirus]|uniref:Uncharacterized protein n=1 Tax=Neodiprion abietis nucleopolyhedrovirus TaxID=204507 RepID=Q0ZP42_9CBAC|nr:hypothetical protein [Neodiprion abietis nucleopolyhedrovirus]ABC74912.1 unknown [Neodiprion abietis nucleopolyhedrovirus]
MSKRCFRIYIYILQWTCCLCRCVYCSICTNFYPNKICCDFVISNRFFYKDVPFDTERRLKITDKNLHLVYGGNYVTLPTTVSSFGLELTSTTLQNITHLHLTNDDVHMPVYLYQNDVSLVNLVYIHIYVGVLKQEAFYVNYAFFQCKKLERMDMYLLGEKDDEKDNGLHNVNFNMDRFFRLKQLNINFVRGCFNLHINSSSITDLSIATHVRNVHSIYREPYSCLNNINLTCDFLATICCIFDEIMLHNVTSVPRIHYVYDLPTNTDYVITYNSVVYTHRSSNAQKARLLYESLFCLQNYSNGFCYLPALTCIICEN